MTREEYAACCKKIKEFEDYGEELENVEDVVDILTYGNEYDGDANMLWAHVKENPRLRSAFLDVAKKFKEVYEERISKL